MSLIAIATLAAAAATTAPVHSVNLDHRGSSYNVDYRAQVSTSTRVIGMSAPARTSTKRCVITATVSVDRVIADGGHALTATLPGTETYTRQVPGGCSNRDDQLAQLVNEKSGAISAHLAQTAANDRQTALAAIDAAHAFAAN